MALLFGGFYSSYCEYRQQAQKLDGEIEGLSQLQRELVHEVEQQQMQLLSLHDPEWIELTLMRCIGVVPKGYTKVYFRPQPQPLINDKPIDPGE
jgi:hypothetical protein